MKGYIQCLLKNKNGEVVHKESFENIVVDNIYKATMDGGGVALSPLRVFISGDNTVPEGDPKLQYGNIGTNYGYKEVSAVSVPDDPKSRQYQCLYPSSCFSPPTEERTIHVIGMAYSGTLLCYKKLSSPIVQTPEQYMEIIYTLTVL